ncbi:MAG: hypothetical protein JSU92_02090, partial [Deltaproteobacteria bacterium]
VDGITAVITGGTATITGLATGCYTATVTVTDACSLSSSTSVGFCVDVTPPTVSITLPTDGSTINTNQVVVQGSCTDIGFGLAVNGCVVEVGGYTADLSGGSTTFSLANGYYTATLTATDVCSLSSSTSVSFWVFVSEGRVSISSPTPGVCINTMPVTVTGTFDSFPGFSVVNVFVNGVTADVVPLGATTSGDYTATITLLEGPQTITVVASDGASTAVASITVTVDITLPSVAIDVPTAGVCINSPTVVVSGTASDIVTGLLNNGVTVQLNGSVQFRPVVAGNWTATFTGVTDGVKTIIASVADNCSNTNSAVRVFSVDTIDPVVTILEPSEGECINSSTVVVSGTATDPFPGSGLPANITVSLDCSNENVLVVPVAVDGSWSASFTIPASAPCTAIASIQDLCGNIGVSTSVPFSVDIGIPTVTVTEPTVNECITTSTVVVSASCSDDLGVFSCEVTVDGVTWKDSPATFVLADGPHTAWARAADDCGNTGVSTQVPFYVDTTPPVVNITSPTNGATLCTATVVVAGSCTDPAPGIGITSCIVEVNGITGDLSDGTETFTVPGTGVYTATLVGLDSCGNGATTTISFEVDVTPPWVNITLPLDGATFCTSTVTVTTTFVDVGFGVVGAVLEVDGITAGILGGTATVTGLITGSYTATVTVTDACSLSSSTSISFSVDTTPPTVSITLPLDGATFCTSTVTVNATLSDIGFGVASAVLEVDGITAVITGGTATITGLATGCYTATVTLTDACSLSSSTSVGFCVDVTPPTVSITSPTDGATFCTTTVTVNATFSDIGFGVATAVLEVDGTTTSIITGSAIVSGLTTGCYTSTVTVTDACSLSSSTSVGFCVDVTPPTVSITSPTDGTTFCTSTVTVTASLTDIGFGVASAVLEVDGITAVITGGTATVTGLATGNYTATVTVTDACSLSSSTSVSFLVDVTPPIVAITSPTAGSTITSCDVVIITGTVSDPSPSGGQPLQVNVTLTGGSYSTTVMAIVSPTTGQWTATLIGIAAGAYTGVITATTNDGCGNTGIAQILVNVNCAGMILAITSPPDGCTPGDLGCPYITCNVTGTSEVYLGGVIFSGAGGQTVDDGDADGFTNIFTDNTATFLTDGIGRKDRLTIGASNYIVLGVMDENNLRVFTDTIPDNLVAAAWEVTRPYVLATFPLEATLYTNGLTADATTLTVTVTGPTPVGSRVQGTSQFAVTFYGLTISSGISGETVDDGDADGFTNIFTDLTASFVTDGVKQGDLLDVAGQAVIVYGVSDENNVFIRTDTLPDNLIGVSWYILEETTTNAAVGRVSGYVEIPIPVYLGSDGLAQNVVISVILDDTDPGTPAATDISIVSMQLAHFGVEQQVAVSVDSSTVGVKVCAFVDPICQVPPFSVPINPINGLLSYDFMFGYDETIIYFELVGPPPDQVYDPTGPFAAFEMGVINEANPAIGGFDMRINSDSGSYWYSPANFMILAEIPFQVLGSTGDMSEVDIELFNWETFRFVDRVNVDLPSDRQQDGVVIITEPPPPPPGPEITSVCDGTETICDPAHIPTGFPSPLVIIGNNFDCSGSGVSITFSNPSFWNLGLLSCSATRLEITAAAFAPGITDVTVTNIDAGSSDTCVGCAQSP